QWKQSIDAFRDFYSKEITLFSFDSYRMEHAVYFMFENEIAKQHVQILVPNSKEQLKFIKYYKQYQKLKLRLEHAEKFLFDWKKIPSKLEIESLEKALLERSFWSKRRTIKRWHNLSHLSIEF